MRIQILCDGFCDFTPSERIGSAFRKLPASAAVGTQSFDDGPDFHPAALLAVRPRRGPAAEIRLPGVRDFLSAVDPAAEELYVVTASAALYGQYDAASQARRLLLAERPALRVHVFNTRSIGVGELLAARRISQLQRSGYAFRQIVERVEAEILSNTCCILPGEPEGVRALGAPARPGSGVYLLQPDGHTVWLCGGLTDPAAEKRLARRIAADPPGRTCLIAHAGCPERARRLARLFQQQKRFASILLTEAGVLTTLLLGRGGVMAAW